MLLTNAITTTLPYQQDVILKLRPVPGLICLKDKARERIFIHPRKTQSFNEVNEIKKWVSKNQEGSIALFYISYDAALPAIGAQAKPSPIHIPLAQVQLYDGYIEIDYPNQSITSHALTPELAALHAALMDEKGTSTFSFTGKLTSSITYPEYEQAFWDIQQGLKQGDYYQVNLAQRFQIPLSGSPLALFHALTEQAPSDYACFWQIDEQASILCNSPEAFIRIDGQQISSSPIKGTIQRDPDPLVDASLANSLKESEKDRAENLMIVDLMRNDLGKIAMKGSVTVTGLFEVMTLSYAHHLVSHISATLPPDTHPIEALLACHPGGSITGAPKRAAMLAIQALEPHPRHIYCGTLGYLTPQGDLRSNIAIRSGIIQNGTLTFWAGGGIVLDSQVAAEYQECMTKIKPVTQLIHEYS